jgi:glycosyltransferase involved in cell wall biosynthesis
MSEHSHPQLEPDPKDAPVAVAQSPEVTVLVPALDEQDTIGEVIALPLSLEVIVVDDGSTDRTPEILASFGDRITVLRSPAPRSGKGSAIRQGLEVAQGEVIVIQDADLEYRPEEIPALVAPILAGEANVVYGTRFSHGFPRGMALPNKIVNKLLVWAVGLLYFRRITDEATCYKAIRRSLLLRMHLVCRRFEFCPEVTAKAFRLGERIVEMPIHYEPRTKAAGKKIRWTDAPVAFWTLLRHRFGRF